LTGLSSHRSTAAHTVIGSLPTGRVSEAGEIPPAVCLEYQI